jgi:hypothetical protein
VVLVVVMCFQLLQAGVHVWLLHRLALLHVLLGTALLRVLHLRGHMCSVVPSQTLHCCADLLTC